MSSFKNIIQKIGEIEQVKGIWLLKEGETEESLQVPLDIETKEKLMNLLKKCIVYIKEMNVGICGYISQYDYLFFKKIEKGTWLVVWANQEYPLSLLKMEVEVLLSEQRQEKRFFKKFKLW